MSKPSRTPLLGSCMERPRCPAFSRSSARGTRIATTPSQPARPQRTRAETLIPLPATRTPMKLHLFLIPAIFVTTAALADSRTAVSPKTADAQTQAAALLSRPPTPVTMKAERSSSVSDTAIDAHASAAALLSGHRIARQATVSTAIREPSYSQMPADAQAQAAALLSGTRTTAGSLPARPVHAVPVAGTDF
jgi:biopolymer transport protein ExbD